MQLSKKTKNFFLNFFAPFLKSLLIFEHFKKTEGPHSLCTSDIQNAKNLNQCLKSTISERPSTVNMLKDPKHF